MYISIPLKVFEDRSLGDQHKLFYAWLSFKANKNGFLFHNNRTIEEETGKEKRLIQMYLKELVEKRYIYIDQKASDQKLYPGSFNGQNGSKVTYWEAVRGGRVIWIYEHWLKANDNKNYTEKPEFKKDHPTRIDYTKFQNQIRNHYADEILLHVNDKYSIGIDVLGKLLKCDKQGFEIEYLSTDEALRVWRYMYENQNAILNPGQKLQHR